MFKNRLASHLERGVIGFPTTLASSVGLIMASPVILTVTSGFGSGGDTFALAVLLAFIMMQAQITTFAEAATLIPRLAPSTTIFPADGAFFRYHRCALRLPDRTHFCRHGRNDSRWRHGAGEL